MVLPVPVPANGVAGVDVTAAFWNAQVRDTATYTLNPPHCVMYQTVATAVNSGVTPVPLDTNEVDSYAGHSTTVNTSRYVAQVAGWYACSGLVAYANPTSTGYRLAGWHKNGSPVNGSSTLLPSCAVGFATCVPAPSREIFLNVGDYVELVSEEGSGTLNTAVTPVDQASMATIRFVHA